jgi:putative ABC transport system substrate-binding protein
MAEPAGGEPDSLGLQLRSPQRQHRSKSSMPDVRGRRPEAEQADSSSPPTPTSPIAVGRLAALAMRHGVPAITQARDFPIAGGLMSYGGDFEQSHRHTRGSMRAVLSRAKRPSNLPVQRVTKVELFHQSEGRQGPRCHPFPPSLLSSADVVIE